MIVAGVVMICLQINRAPKRLASDGPRAIETSPYNTDKVWLADLCIKNRECLREGGACRCLYLGPAKDQKHVKGHYDNPADVTPAW